MSSMKSDRRWTCASWKVVLGGLACIFLLIGVVVWLENQKNGKVPKPIEWVIVERALLDEMQGDVYPFVVSPIELDPYDSALRSLTLRARHGFYKASLLLPPRLISKFGPHAGSTEEQLTTSAIWLSALLPDLTLRAPDNVRLFKDRLVRRLEITITANEPWYRTPDHLYRSGMTCEKASAAYKESDYPGLLIDPERLNKGHHYLIACAPRDALPDRNPFLIYCWRNPYTRELATCRIEFIVPWQNYSQAFQQRLQQAVEAAGRAPRRDGTTMIIEFPSAYLPQWRRVRDLSACLIETVVVEIEQIGFPSRNSSLCETIRSALHEGQSVLVPGPVGAN